MSPNLTGHLPREERRHEPAGCACPACGGKLHVIGEDVSEVLDYGLVNWTALTRYSEDGRLEIDNNRAENTLRSVALGRKNWLFAGSDAAALAPRRSTA